MAKAKVVKMCDMEVDIALRVFEQLNPGRLTIENVHMYGNKVIVTDEEPDKLIYPEGWYYAKGCFRNKHTSTTGFYSEVTMVKSDKTLWVRKARYCTL